MMPTGRTWSHYRARRRRTDWRRKVARAMTVLSALIIAAGLIAAAVVGAWSGR